MILQPFSVLSGQDYKKFLAMNYIVRIPEHGLKKINLKGLNKIGLANDTGFIKISEQDIKPRRIEEIYLDPSLISDEEKQHLSEMVKTRFDPDQTKELSFSDIGASFSIELLDIVFIDELKCGELSKSLEIIKDSMIFAEKGSSFDLFVKHLESYGKYLENPSDHNLLKSTKDGLEKCIDSYEANPFAHFLLGLIYHRPTLFFDLERSSHFFFLSKKYSLEIEDNFLKALSNFMQSWLLYLSKDYDKSIEHLLEAADYEFMHLPEAFYNLAKLYAAKGDGANAVKYLDEAVGRFDFFYAMKADSDQDFDGVKEDIRRYFSKLRDEEKQSITKRLSEFGIIIRSDIKERPDTEYDDDRV